MGVARRVSNLDLRTGRTKEVVRLNIFHGNRERVTRGLQYFVRSKRELLWQTTKPLRKLWDSVEIGKFWAGQLFLIYGSSNPFSA